MRVRGRTGYWVLSTGYSQPQQQRRATSSDRLLLDAEQDREFVFDSAAEPEPCGQRDAARGLRRNVGEVEDDQAEASAFEEQVGGAEDLLQAVFGVALGGILRNRARYAARALRF